MGFILAVFAAFSVSHAQEGIYNTRSHTWLTLSEAAAEINPGTIVVLGEQHVTKDNQTEREIVLHHENQLRWLKQMNIEAAARGFSAQLGMEFLIYLAQDFVDDFLAGKMTEADFLQAVVWGGNPFAPYGALMQESKVTGTTLALNIPPYIARHVAKDGPASLTPAEQSLLPLIWERGGPEYFERFEAAMGGHVPKDKLENYFWAQSLWDDTMAWRATRRHTPLEQLTIVVGEFHAEFGHGLPARLKRYGAQDVRSMIQVGISKTDSRDDAVKADSKYGERADYIWVFVKD